MNKKQEEFIRKQLNYFASEQIMLHAKGFERHELTVEEFAKEDERITKKTLRNIEWAMTNM